MTEHLIACLATRYGDLCVYDMVAFSSIVDKCFAMGRIERDSEMIFEGFSSKAWADYAKHKSRIATSVCKINGELKARLAALDEKHAPGMVDPLLDADPWADRLGMGKSKPNQTPTCSKAAWSSWRPRAHVNEPVAQQPFCGDWRTIPSDAWKSIHDRFAVDEATASHCVSPLVLTAPPQRMDWAGVHTETVDNEVDLPL